MTSTPGDLTQLIVNLTPRATTAMRFAADAMGDDNTGTVNLALQLYAQLAHATVEHPSDGTRAFDWPAAEARIAVRTGPQRWWQRW
jgi:hypothetical protein